MADAPTLYRFDPATGELLGPDRATESPLEPGVWHWPANTTDKVPPALLAQQVAQFIEGSWFVAADHRGETWFTASGDAFRIADIGDIPAGLVAERPPQWNDLRVAAQNALNTSDRTVLRCYEANVPVPPEWREYRADLRAIVAADSGNALAELPTRPPFPADT